MPVALAGETAGLEHDVAGTEFGEARGGREPPEPAPCNVGIVGRRITGGVALGTSAGHGGDPQVQPGRSPSGKSSGV